jgi:hypothetical protein
VEEEPGLLAKGFTPRSTLVDVRLFSWLVGWLVGLLVGWLVGWLVDYFMFDDCLV